MGPDATAPTSPYAGLVTRTAALGVDVAVLTLATIAISTLPSLAWSRLLDTAPQWLVTGSAAVAAATPFAYFTSCWWLGGATIGGLLLGIMVRDDDGAKLSLPRSALRAWFGLLLAPIWLIGLFGVLRDRRRRAWHDRLFGTVVRYHDRYHQR